MIDGSGMIPRHPLSPHLRVVDQMGAPEEAGDGDVLHEQHVGGNLGDGAAREADHDGSAVPVERAYRGLEQLASDHVHDTVDSRSPCHLLEPNGNLPERWRRRHEQPVPKCIDRFRLEHATLARMVGEVDLGARLWEGAGLRGREGGDDEDTLRRRECAHGLAPALDLVGGEPIVDASLRHDLHEDAIIGVGATHDHDAIGLHDDALRVGCLELGSASLCVRTYLCRLQPLAVDLVALPVSTLAVAAAIPHALAARASKQLGGSRRAGSTGGLRRR